MRIRKNPMTPLAAVVAGLLAGAAGTVCLDAVHYLKYRRAGGTDSLLGGADQGALPVPPRARRLRGSGRVLP
jgi:hypothetical protein